MPTAPSKRPDFMETLGLLPPYAPDDVEAAYREKVKSAHPDRGGTVAAFRKLQEAYDQAKVFVKFRESRRQWLALQIEHYAEQEQFITELRGHGAIVEMEHFDWLKKSVGEDFAAVTERIQVIRHWNSPHGDALLKLLGERTAMLDHVRELDLTGSRVTDQGLAKIGALPLLKQLRLTGTAVTAAGISSQIEQWPQLAIIDVGKSGIGTFDRWKLGWKHGRIKFVAR